MDLLVLFGVFNQVLKCLEYGNNMTDHWWLPMLTWKRRIASPITLSCNDSMECEWKYCFYTSQKQGPSYEVNMRAVLGLLAFREIGRDHNTMVIFTKVMNMSSRHHHKPAGTLQKCWTKSCWRLWNS